MQYACKLIWYMLWKKKSNSEYIEILKRLEAAMSNTRKILRLGKSHEMLENALKSIHLQDDFLRNILTFSYINQSCYLLLDNATWLNSMGIVNLKARANELNRWSNKFWLFSAILFVARDIHDLIGVIQGEENENDNNNRFSQLNKYTLNETSGAYTSVAKKSTSSSVVSKKTIIMRILKKLRSLLCKKRNQPLLLDTAKNLCDMFLPMSNLEFIKISPGMQGFLGLISSLISLLIVFNQKYKLSP